VRYGIGRHYRIDTWACYDDSWASLNCLTREFHQVLTSLRTRRRHGYVGSKLIGANCFGDMLAIQCQSDVIGVEVLSQRHGRDQVGDLLGLYALRVAEV